MSFVLIIPLVGQTCFPIVVGAVVFALFYFAFHQHKTSKGDYSKLPNALPSNNVDLSPRTRRHRSKKYEALLEAVHRESSSSSDSDEKESKHDPSKPHVCSSESKQKISLVKIWVNKKEFSEDVLDKLLNVVTKVNIKVDLCDLTNTFVLPTDKTILNIFLLRGHSSLIFDSLKESGEEDQAEPFLYHICSFHKEDNPEYELDIELDSLLESYRGEPLKKFAKFRVCETKDEHFGSYMKKLSRILKNSSKKCCGSCIKGKTVDIEDIAWPLPSERVKVETPLQDT